MIASPIAAQSPSAQTFSRVTGDVPHHHRRNSHSPDRHPGRRRSLPIARAATVQRPSGAGTTPEMQFERGLRGHQAEGAVHSPRAATRDGKMLRSLRCVGCIIAVIASSSHALLSTGKISMGY